MGALGVPGLGGYLTSNYVRLGRMFPCICSDVSIPATGVDERDLDQKPESC
jgi:hypothetical protein